MHSQSHHRRQLPQAALRSVPEGAEDVVSYAKNYLAVYFKLDYVNADGNSWNYYPDFIVKLTDGRIVIVETKGLEDLDLPLKMGRLKQCCEDVNRAQDDTTYVFVYVDDNGFQKYKPTSFANLLLQFKEYQIEAAYFSLSKACALYEVFVV